MKGVKKEIYIAFLFFVVLIVFYKSMDNLGTITGWIKTVLGVLKPFFVGFVIAYILNLPCKKIEGMLEKSKSPFFAKKSKGISILAVYLIALLILFISVRALVPKIYTNCLDLYNNAPAYLEKIMILIESWQEKLNISIISLDTDASFMSRIEGYIKSINMAEFSKYAQGVVNLTSGVMNTFIALIVSVYMLLDSDRIIESLKGTLSVFLSDEWADRIGGYFSKVNDIFSKYIYCRLVDAVIIAVLSTVLLTVMGVKYSLVLGIMIGVLNVIPYFGSIISTVLAMLITVVTGGIAKMIWVGVALLVLQQIDGNFIGPKIMGEAFEIRPLAVILAVTVGGGLFGMIGLLICVPIAVVLKMIIGDFIESKRLKKAAKNGDYSI